MPTIYARFETKEDAEAHVASYLLTYPRSLYGTEVVVGDKPTPLIGSKVITPELQQLTPDTEACAARYPVLVKLTRYSST